jgi:hypothetical protein
MLYSQVDELGLIDPLNANGCRHLELYQNILEMEKNG